MKLEEMLFETFCKSREELPKLFEEACKSEGDHRIQHILSPIEKYKAQRVVVIVLNDSSVEGDLIE